MMDEELKPKTDDNKGSPRSFRMYIISSVLLALAVALCLFVTVQTMVNGYTNFFGYSVFRVVTGSMEPTIPVDAVLVSKTSDIGEIAVGDIICFRSRESSHYGAIVTHRVVSIQTDENGGVLLESRGDANYSSDPYFVREDNLIGRVIWYTQREGILIKILSFVSGKIGFMALIIIPVMVIAGLVLQGVGKNIRTALNDAMTRLAADSRKKSDDDEPLPGYKTLTRRDYNEIYAKLKSELWKELNDSAEETEGKMEYSEDSQ